MKSKFHLACFSFTCLATASAVPIQWIGEAGGDFFDPFNWSDEIGPDPDGDPATAYEGDILFSNSSATAAQNLLLGTGFNMTVTNSTLDFTGFTIQGVQNAATDASIQLNKTTLTVNSVANDVMLNLTNRSELRLFGVNNSINGNNTPTNNTRVLLGDGSKITHINGNNGNAGTGATVGQRIFRAASGISFESDFASPPLTEFIISGDSTPFTAPNGGSSTITAVDPAPSVPVPEIIIGYRLVPPEQNQPVWYPTYRTATDWQINLDIPQIARFGFAGITDAYLADLNGDGLSDKVMRQTANNGGTNPSQVIASYTTAPPDGFATSTNFNPPAGDLQVPFLLLSAADTKLIFGDLDKDKIDDSGVTVDGSKVGGAAGQLTWGMYKSAGIAGISKDQGANANFTGWNVFGDLALGDLGYLGDFNGDGVADRMIYRVSTRQVFIDLSVAGNFGDGMADYSPIPLGVAGDAIYVSDINGDGKDDLVVARDTSQSPPPNNTPGLQTLYGYYNDGSGFSALVESAPDITDLWGAGEGLLFGNIVPLPENTAGFKITQIGSAGPEMAFSGTFQAIRAGTYRVEASLNLQSPWQVMETLSIASPGPASFSISDSQLDTAFGPATRAKVFVRISLLP